jgi:hypothetical protein
MEKLKQELDILISKLPDPSVFRATVETLASIYPFNEFEYIIANLLGRNLLKIDEYVQLRADYITRNKFLEIFEISAPRTFGETWAQGQLQSLIPALQKPTKKLDSTYSGEYDFFLDNKIKIEVKASRATDAKSAAPLYVKALSSDSAASFRMNFQQIKPRSCDVFVFIAVWRDIIRYWVFPSYEIAQHPLFSSGQHRGNTGEGQLHFRNDNITQFDKFLVSPENLLTAIREAYAQQLTASQP